MTLCEMQDRDFEWFVENYDRLFSEYGDSYLAIKDKSILGHYTSYADAVNETEKTEELGTFIVQHCNGDESGYTAYIAPIIYVEDAAV